MQDVSRARAIAGRRRCSNAGSRRGGRGADADIGPYSRARQVPQLAIAAERSAIARDSNVLTTIVNSAHHEDCHHRSVLWLRATSICPTEIRPGASGVLGSAIRKAFESASGKDYEVIPLSHSQSGNGLIPLDLTDSGKVEELLSSKKPNCESSSAGIASSGGR